MEKHSGINFLHRRDCNLDAMKSYHTQLKDSLDLAYPFFKRVNLASVDSPKGWFKKKNILTDYFLLQKKLPMISFSQMNRSKKK